MAPQRERIPTQWTLKGPQDDSPSVKLTGSDKDLSFDFTFETIRPNVFRTRFTSEKYPIPPFPSIPEPKHDLSSGPKPVVTSAGQIKTIAIGDFEASVDWETSTTPVVSVSHRSGGGDGAEAEKKDRKPLHTDIPNRSYTANGDGIAHFTRYNRGTLHVGLGEKAAPMDLSGRKFDLAATDSFGYDVYRTDPLYKNIPLLINATPDGCVATFSTMQGRGSYSVGSEMDGMWGFYKVYRQDYGGLDEYIIVGRTLRDVVSTYAQLAGFPLLVPRWAMGYISGGYKYSMLDSPPANEALLEVAQKLRENDIPCSAHQMSSGYHVSHEPPKSRHVFHWNRYRFPDPEAFLAEYRRQGIRVIANMKPYVLKSHPEHQKLADAGAFFTDPITGTYGETPLWSAGGGTSSMGSHIDFTSAAGFKWWYDGVRRMCEQGVACMWNDNNEYTITSDDWRLRLDLDLPGIAAAGADDSSAAARARPDVGLWGRYMHTELHGKASHDAMVDHDPDTRPFVLTRGATAGTMRYAASTWSGDNITSWDGMKGANALSLNAGMSLIHCYGHDIGGFEGEQPSPELLLRWVQLGCHSPRFAINCFKTGNDSTVGDVIEPWMYPAITPHVRSAIKRRYEMIPYIYSLMLEGHLTAVPPQRWTGWGYESDPVVWTSDVTNGETQYWLGGSLLVGGVYEPGVNRSRVYLPKGSDQDDGYININAPFQHIPAGQWADIDAEWHGAGIPLLAKVGTVIPVGRDVQVLSAGEKDNVASLPLDDYRAVEIFPPPTSSAGKWYADSWYEDDGVSSVQKNRISQYKFSYTATDDKVTVKFDRDESSGFVAPWKTLVVILPAGDDRVVTSDGAKVTELAKDVKGRRRFELS
ncbi:Alpha-glucosidase, glycosyl hydrolase family GH31 [Geosmithia morbida]|uniref:alpha-glucosidase n=1 Tax=Geosmithia morbida TaxID=1094350 RepID=A0A9P5D0J2_9HYPO|nr:Alpha-glucosidase, glycosyl hydrolase family GH31 [Geosmithia morbida]KAF4119506.1 Alpha-glucosidase, glycosyl hydrolase family GH31 [Geosmithia morbida]